ncbi:MAG: insulinase family protein [Acidobacteria bacterium]|nr:MAG: insulinase family protein [Acidobacteriota bacterium]
MTTTPRTSPLVVLFAVAAAWLPALGARAGAAAAAPPQPVEWRIDPATAVTLVEDHRVPVITLRLRFPVGTWSPWARERHVEEAFEIQFYDPEGALRRRADALGIRPSLEVSQRQAELAVTFLARDLDEVSRLVRDILSNRDFDRRELKRWRQQRKLLWKEQQTSPAFRLGQAAMRALFRPGDPRRLEYEKPPRLSTDTAELAAARDLVLALPGRQIGFAGDIDRERAEAIARGLLPPPLEEPPEGLEPDLPPPVDPEKRPREVTVAIRRLTQVYLGLARVGLPETDPDYPAFLVADHVLGGNFYSRLSVALRHEEGDTYGAFTHGGGGLVPSGYGPFTFTRAPNAAAAKEKLHRVIDEFHARGITEEERERAAGYLLGRRWTRRANPDAILREAMWEARFGLPHGFRDRLAEKAAALPLEKVNAFIERFYDPARLVEVTVAPK